jgi:uncharacterized phiE125 gp8 family phage protein
VSVLDYSVTVTTVGTSELISVADAKHHARIDIDADDTLVANALKRAWIEVERDARRDFRSHTYDFAYDRFPNGRCLRLPRTPLSSVTHLKYIDTDGTLTTWAASNYEVDEPRDTIWLAWTIDWPAIRDIQNAVQIRAVFAHAATDEELELAKQAVLLQTAAWYEHRAMDKHETASYDAIVSRIARRSYP